MAAEIICSRWTVLILREMLCGSTRFNDIRRGVPRMSPTLLSKRLKELEEAGVIAEHATGQAGIVEYKLSEAGNELRGVVMALGVWGQRWVEADRKADAGQQRARRAGPGFPERHRGRPRQVWTRRSSQARRWEAASMVTPPLIWLGTVLH
jgi:DNA-binding HxlR family transcriptional regulator